MENAPNTERVDHEDIDLALTISMEKTDIRFRVVSYEKGYLSGQVKVLFPKSKQKNALLERKRAGGQPLKLLITKSENRERSTPEVFA